MTETLQPVLNKIIYTAIALFIVVITCQILMEVTTRWLKKTKGRKPTSIRITVMVLATTAIAASFYFLVTKLIMPSTAQGIATNNKAQAIENQKRAEKQQAIQRQLDKTCNFWISEYKKTRTEKDRIHKDNACRDARRQIY